MWLMSTHGERAEEMSRHTQDLNATTSVIPFRHLFLMRTFWISLAIGTAVNISWHFYRVWLPRHLVVDLRFTDQQLQYLLIAFYLTADVGSIAIGFVTRRLVSAQRSVERARKIAIMVGAILCLLPTLILLSPGRAIMVPLYCLAGAGIM